MPVKRSRQGCEECRRRRRKCDEQKPTCGQCAGLDRACNYTLKLVWGGRKFKKSRFGQCLRPGDSAKRIGTNDGGFVYGVKGALRASSVPTVSLPRCLPNGVPLPQKYRTLLSYFTEGILASLSCHPSIHQDLCRGLVPAMLESPHLLSAALALSAAGYVSRGLSEVEGVDILRILEHLHCSGLSLLSKALADGQMDEIMLATCLIWCLADVFACRQGQGVSSWRIHLQGIKAILDGNPAHQYFASNSGHAQSAMRHLYLLYLSLQTLPYIPSLDTPRKVRITTGTSLQPVSNDEAASSRKIDGFLGYSEELLHILQQINIASESRSDGTEVSSAEADILLGKVKGMMTRDAKAPPDVLICESLSPEFGREFLFSHKIFQQATLICLYRTLYHMPSGSRPIQAAIEEIMNMVSNMAQGQPCHTWVAMAMPIFTIGCEAFTDEQKGFVLDKIHQLEVCIGSLHVQVIRQALEDMWKVRSDLGDVDGGLCASQLLAKLQYNIILF